MVSGAGGAGPGDMGNAVSNYPDVYMALFLLYKLDARGNSMSFRTGSKNNLKFNSNSNSNHTNNVNLHLCDVVLRDVGKKRIFFFSHKVARALNMVMRVKSCVQGWVLSLFFFLSLSRSLSRLILSVCGFGTFHSVSHYFMSVIFSPG